ncbi:MAG: HD domain-containing protein [Flavobacteriaceae bacterium]|nr:HD domain-containing protein [Flavobacteriaceae bacterium]
MNKEAIINNTIAYVKGELKHAEGGHDWFHIQRVFNNAKLISREEKVDVFVVSLATLLHDIADAKFHNGDETIGPKKASEFLHEQKVENGIIAHVVNIITHLSYKNEFSNSKRPINSIEFQVVQDADRLDAIGAIGIARCFNYGGFKNRALYNPEIKPNLNMTKQEYKNSNAPTLNHFYEKLLILKDKMNTKSGKKIAQQRHEFMESYLEQFYDEWNGVR